MSLNIRLPTLPLIRPNRATPLTGAAAAAFTAAPPLRLRGSPPLSEGNMSLIRSNVLRFTSAAALWLAAPAASAAPAIYHLGTLGGSESYGTAVNNAGQVAGLSHIGDSTRAFRY